MSYITTKFKKYTFKGLECNGISINGNGITDQFTNGNQSIKTEINSSVITQPVEIVVKLKVELSNTTQQGFLFTSIYKKDTEYTSPYSLRIRKDSNGYYTRFFIRRNYSQGENHLISYFENNLDWLYVKYINDGENQTISVYDNELNLLTSKTEKILLTPVWDDFNTNLWIYHEGGSYSNTLVPKFIQYDLSESYIKDLTTGKVLSDWNK